MTKPMDLAEELAQVAQTFHEEAGVEDTIRAITSAAAEVIPGAEMSAIARRRRGAVVPMVMTDDLIGVIDGLQTELGEGPCLSALIGADEVLVEDFSEDGRWPALAPEAVALGVHSALTFRLALSGRTVGSLSLFATKPGAFDDESVRVGRLFAVHAAVALAGATKEADLSTALDTRDVIGQAKGVLMERHGLSSDEAFAALARLSQTRHLKLIDVAHTLIRGAGSGRAPGGLAKPPPS